MNSYTPDDYTYNLMVYDIYDMRNDTPKLIVQFAGLSISQFFDKFNEYNLRGYYMRYGRFAKKRS